MSAGGTPRAHLPRHEPAVLAELTGADEPLLLEHRDGGVVEERARDLAPYDLLGRALHRSPSESCDLSQGTLQRGGGHPLAPVGRVDEEAGDAPGRRGDGGLAVGPSELDPWQ